MKVIILAAGQGKRLRPLTDTRPKCLVDLAGESLLDRQLDTLRHCGLEDIVIIGGWRAEQLENKGTRFYTNPQFAQSNMVETLFCAGKEFDGMKDMLICYSDIVYESKIISAILNTDGVIATTIDKDWRNLWSMRMEDPLADAETLKLDDRGFITELGKKPKSYDDIQGQYMGIVRVNAAAQGAFCASYMGLPEVDAHGRHRKDIFMTDFLQHIIDTKHPIKAVPVHGGWLEVDTLEDIVRYEAALKQGTLKKQINLYE